MTIGAAAIPYLLAATTAATVAAGVYSYRQQKRAGEEEAYQIGVQKRAEGQAAKRQEIERRRNLMRALSSQSAAAGAAGISTSGSFGNQMLKDIEDNENDLLINRAGFATRQAALSSASRNARSAANANANISLFQTAQRAGSGAVDTYNAAKKPKKPQ